MPSLARSVPKPLKLPSLARYVPKPLLIVARCRRPPPAVKERSDWLWNDDDEMMMKWWNDKSKFWVFDPDETFICYRRCFSIAPIVFHLDEVDMSDIVWSIGSLGTIGVQWNKCDKIWAGRSLAERNNRGVLLGIGGLTSGRGPQAIWGLRRPH